MELERGGRSVAPFHLELVGYSQVWGILGSQCFKGRQVQCEITARFLLPPEDLRPYFTTFYWADVDPAEGEVRDSLQPEWGGVRFFRGATPVSWIGGEELLERTDFSAMGPTTGPIDFRIGKTRIWGIGLLPLGWATFMHVPANEMANQIFDGNSHPAFRQFLPLARTLTAEPDKIDQEYAAIVRFFREDITYRKVDRERVLAIHEMLLDPDLSDVASMAKRAGLSQRTLERICRRVFGFPPKTLLRRQRFMRSLARFMIDPSLGWIGAMDSLYFDQSQFVRDCHAFLGMTPSEYVALDHPILEAFMRERARVHGSAVQTLDKPG